MTEAGTKEVNSKFGHVTVRSSWNVENSDSRVWKEELRKKSFGTTKPVQPGSRDAISEFV